MITVFNRRELYSTYSMEAQAKVRDALCRFGIDYLVDTSSGMARNYGAGPIVIDRFGTDPLKTTQYRIFVRKKDYEKAAAAVQGKLEGN